MVQLTIEKNTNIYNTIYSLINNNPKEECKTYIWIKDINIDYPKELKLNKFEITEQI